MFESASYFPLLGFYLGDRAGPFVEFKFDPFSRLEIYGSASEYENNIAKDPTLPTFKTSSESGGASATLPGNLSLTAQVTLLNLSVRSNAANPWVTSKDRQELITLARPMRKPTPSGFWRGISATSHRGVPSSSARLKLTTIFVSAG